MDGVHRLHDLEAEALAFDLRRTDPAVITAAASTVANPISRSLLRRHAFVVWLDADPAISAKRMLEGDHRPDLGREDGDAESHVRALREERADWFRAVADLIIDTSELTAEEVVDHILAV